VNGAMKVTVDHDKCVGAGQCVLAAPEVFDQGEEGIVELLDTHPPAELDDAVRAATHMCPAQAIRMRDR
jgi:ferredoxin